MQAIKIVFSIEVFLTERLEILPDNYDKNFYVNTEASFIMERNLPSASIRNMLFKECKS